MKVDVRERFKSGRVRLENAGAVGVHIDTPTPRWVREHGTLHIVDVREQNEFPFSDSTVRTFLAVPLRLQEEFIGALNARRNDVRPFTPAQIKLLETFADQAVIAIENVRLFKELEERTRQITEALEQQTATSEILRVIASSPTDIHGAGGRGGECGAFVRCEQCGNLADRRGELLACGFQWSDTHTAGGTGTDGSRVKCRTGNDRPANHPLPRHVKR